MLWLELMDLEERRERKNIQNSRFTPYNVGYAVRTLSRYSFIHSLIVCNIYVYVYICGVHIDGKRACITVNVLNLHPMVKMFAS